MDKLGVAFQWGRSLRFLLSLILLSSAFTLVALAAGNEQELAVREKQAENLRKVFEQKPYASIVRLQGSGTTKIRRKAGTISVAARDDKIFEGDRLITDGASMAELLLVDGSMIRVGLNSEYKLENVKKEKRIWSYGFGLEKGSVRALVEKSSDKKTVKFRTRSPAGSMGVRGTEFIFNFDKVTRYSEIYTLSGLVFFGAPDCEKKKTCINVPKGKKSRIKEGDERPEAISDFAMQDLLHAKLTSKEEKSKKSEKGSVGETTNLGEAGQAKSNSDASANTEDAKAVASLFEDVTVKDFNATELNLNEAASRAMLEKARDDLQKAQDYYLGRTAKMRESQHALMDKVAEANALAEGSAAAEAMKEARAGEVNQAGGTSSKGVGSAGAKLGGKESAFTNKSALANKEKIGSEASSRAPVKGVLIKRNENPLNFKPELSLATLDKAILDFKSGRVSGEDLFKQAEKSRSDFEDVCEGSFDRYKCMLTGENSRAEVMPPPDSTLSPGGGYSCDALATISAQDKMQGGSANNIACNVASTDLVQTPVSAGGTTTSQKTCYTYQYECKYITQKVCPAVIFGGRCPPSPLKEVKVKDYNSCERKKVEVPCGSYNHDDWDDHRDHEGDGGGR